MAKKTHITAEEILKQLDGANAIASNAAAVEKGDTEFTGHPEEDIDTINRILRLARRNIGLLDESGKNLIASTESHAKWVYGDHFEADPWDDFDDDFDDDED